MQPRAATLQKINSNNEKFYAITPSIPGGLVEADFLEKLAKVAKKYNAILKVTTAQRIMITMLKSEDVNIVWDELGIEPDDNSNNCVQSVVFCPGDTFCKRGKQDSVQLGKLLNNDYFHKQMPRKFKIGVSGCPNACGFTQLKDIGLVGLIQGWSIYVGGQGGFKPRIGQLLIENLTLQQAYKLTHIIIAYYQKHARLERLGVFIERIGFDLFKDAVLNIFYNNTTTEFSTPETVAQSNVINSSTPKLKQITLDSIIADIISSFPETIPVLQSMQMGCLGCPSATGETLAAAAKIHGLNEIKLLNELNKTIQGGASK